MKPLTEYAKATPERQDEMLREWARLAVEKNKAPQAQEAALREIVG
jgi:hypothetical protein